MADQSRAEISNFYCVWTRIRSGRWRQNEKLKQKTEMVFGGFHHHPELRNMIDVRTKLEEPVVKF